MTLLSTISHLSMKTQSITCLMKCRMKWKSWEYSRIKRLCRKLTIKVKYKKLSLRNLMWNLDSFVGKDPISQEFMWFTSQVLRKIMSICKDSQWIDMNSAKKWYSSSKKFALNWKNTQHWQRFLGLSIFRLNPYLNFGLMCYKKIFQN